MEPKETIDIVLNYGGLIILAGLFVWVFIQDKMKNSKLLEQLAKQSEENGKMVQALVDSNQNIAKSLDIIGNNMVTIDRKIDRNYEQEIKNSQKGQE